MVLFLFICLVGGLPLAALLYCLFCDYCDVSGFVVWVLVLRFGGLALIAICMLIGFVVDADVCGYYDFINSVV